MFSLTSALRKKLVEEIFRVRFQPTTSIPESYGFSDQIIPTFLSLSFVDLFRKPLEYFPQGCLNLYSSVLRWVMPLSGREGWGKSRKMLSSKLSRTQIFSVKKVKAVHQGSIELEKLVNAFGGWNRLSLPQQTRSGDGAAFKVNFAKPKFVKQLLFYTQKSFMARPIDSFNPGRGDWSIIWFFEWCFGRISPKRSPPAFWFTIFRAELSEKRVNKLFKSN